MPVVAPPDGAGGGDEDSPWSMSETWCPERLRRGGLASSGAIASSAVSADVAFDFFAEAEGFFDFMREIHVCAVGSLRETVFFSDDSGGLSRKRSGSSRSTCAVRGAPFLSS